MAVLLIFVILGTIAIAAIVALIIRAVMRKARGIDIDTRGGAGMTAIAVTPPPTKRRRIDFLSIGLGVWTVIVLIFLFLPIGFIVAHSFNKGKALLVWQGFSTKWYHELFKNEPLLQAIRNSLKVAVGSTLIAVVLGAFAGIALARRGGKWATGFMAIVFLILVTPEIVDAIALLIWFVRIGGPFASGLTFLNAGDGATLRGSLLVQLCRGDAHRPRSTAGPRRVVGGGCRRPRRDAVARVPPDHVAPHGPGPPRRRPPGLHVQPRQHDRLDVREHGGVDDPSGVRLLLRALGDQARHRGRGDPHAAAHTVCAGRCGVRAPKGRRDGRRRRRDAHRQLSEPIAWPDHAK